MEEPKPNATEVPKEVSEPKEKSKADGPKKKTKKVAKPKDTDKEKDISKETPKEDSTVDTPKENTIIDSPQQNTPDASQGGVPTEPKPDVLQQNGEPTQNGTLKENIVAMETGVVDAPIEHEKPQENGNVNTQENAPTDILRKDSKVDVAPQIPPMENTAMEVPQSDDPNFNVIVENTKSGPPKVTSSFQVIPSDPEQLRRKYLYVLKFLIGDFINI